MQNHRVVVAALLLTACTEGFASTTLNVPVDEIVVLGAMAIEDNDKVDWRISLEAASAPAGEYLLFRSGNAPTSASALASYDAKGCSTFDDSTPACVVMGVGVLAGEKVLDADGTLTLSENAFGEIIGRRAYYTIVRRPTIAGAAATSLKATVTVGGNDGCASTPESPAVLIQPALAP